MILDRNLEFADAVQVTLAAGTNLIGDVVDLEVVRDIGFGRPLYLVVQVDTAFAGGTSFQFVLASDAQAAITTDGTETRHYLSDVFAVADLIQGFQLAIALPMGDVAASVNPYERYLGVLGVGVGTQTAGSVNLFLTLDPPTTTRTYPGETGLV